MRRNSGEGGWSKYLRGPYVLAFLVLVFCVLFVGQMGFFKKAPTTNNPPVLSVQPAVAPTNQSSQGGATAEDELRQAHALAKSLGASMDALQSRHKALSVEAVRLSNLLTSVTQSSEAFRKQAAASLEEAKAELLARSKRIETLERELGALNQQLRDLGERIARQDARIAETERRAATSEEARVALRASLESMQAEKRELESRYRTKDSMVAQVTKLRNGEVAARDSLLRRSWLGSLGSKGASKGAKANTPKPSPGTVKSTKPRVEVADVASPRAKANQPAVGIRSSAVVPPSDRLNVRTNVPTTVRPGGGAERRGR